MAPFDKLTSMPEAVFTSGLKCLDPRRVASAHLKNINNNVMIIMINNRHNDKNHNNRHNNNSNRNENNNDNYVVPYSDPLRNIQPLKTLHPISRTSRRPRTLPKRLTPSERVSGPLVSVEAAGLVFRVSVAWRAPIKAV